MSDYDDDFDDYEEDEFEVRRDVARVRVSGCVGVWRWGPGWFAMRLHQARHEACVDRSIPPCCYANQGDTDASGRHCIVPPQHAPAECSGCPPGNQAAHSGVEDAGLVTLLQSGLKAAMAWHWARLHKLAYTAASWRPTCMAHTRPARNALPAGWWCDDLHRIAQGEEPAAEEEDYDVIPTAKSKPLAQSPTKPASPQLASVGATSPSRNTAQRSSYAGVRPASSGGNPGGGMAGRPGVWMVDGGARVCENRVPTSF